MSQITTTPDRDALRAMPIRDIVERWPEAMSVLAPLGIDLCCGGAHPLSEALQLHGIPEAEPVDAVLAIVAQGEAGQ